MLDLNELTARGEDGQGVTGDLCQQFEHGTDVLLGTCRHLRLHWPWYTMRVRVQMSSTLLTHNASSRRAFMIWSHLAMSLPARSAGWALVHFSAALIDRRQRSFGRLIIEGQRLRTWPRTLQGSKMHDSQVRAHARSKTFMEGIAKAVKDEAASQIAASRTVRGTWSISRQHDRARRHIKTSKPTSQ